MHGDTLRLLHFTGFPQGGAASALFWTIAFNPAIEIINIDDINGNGYADDCAALLGGPNIDQLVPRMQAMLDILVAWGLTCGLHFNPQKTVAMVFTRSFRVFDSHLVINARQICYSDSVRYLGLILDKKLYWNLHMRDKIKKGKAFLMKIANVAREMWGPKPHLLRWAFTCVVRPMIIYACMIWGPTVNSSYSEKFRRLNRMAMNTYAPFPRSSPTRLLEILTDTFPLDLYIKKEGLCAFIRLQADLPLTWTGIDNTITTRNIAHRRFWLGLKTDSDLDDITSIPSDLCNFRPLGQRSFSVIEESFGGNEIYLALADINVYTDGSKNELGVGSAFRVVADDVIYREGSSALPSYSTVFQAEVHAVKAAAESLLMIPENLNIKFFVDSQSALKALIAREISSKLVKSAVDALNNIPNAINFVWIKSHSGNEHNDAVDKLAKDAALEVDVVGEVLPSRKHIRNMVISRLRVCWDEMWAEYPEARQSKIFYTNQDPLRAKEACRLTRRKLSRLIRIVTGHNGLLYHQHNIENAIDPSCRFCNDDNESFEHFVLRCPAFDAERYDTFQGRNIEGTMDWKIDELLNFSYLQRVDDALTWRHRREQQAEVVIHDFSDSGSDPDEPEPGDINLTASEASDNSDYDSDFNVDEDLLEDDFQ